MHPVLSSGRYSACGKSDCNRPSLSYSQLWRHERNSTVALRRADYDPGIHEEFRTRNARTERTLIAWELAFRACAVVRVTTDAANIILGHVPSPRGDCAPGFDPHLHGRMAHSYADVGMCEPPVRRVKSGGEELRPIPLSESTVRETRFDAFKGEFVTSRVSRLYLSKAGYLNRTVFLRAVTICMKHQMNRSC